MFELSYLSGGAAQRQGPGSKLALLPTTPERQERLLGHPGVMLPARIPPPFTSAEGGLGELGRTRQQARHTPLPTRLSCVSFGDF